MTILITLFCYYWKTIDAEGSSLDFVVNGSQAVDFS